jgi:hypothetical protein
MNNDYTYIQALFDKPKIIWFGLFLWFGTYRGHGLYGPPHGLRNGGVLTVRVVLLNKVR